MTYNPLEAFHEADETKRINDEAARRTEAMRQNVIRNIVDAGTEAVEHGDTTPDSLPEQLWATVARHRTMLFQTVGQNLGSPIISQRSSRSELNIDSRPVDLDDELEARLLIDGFFNREGMSQEFVKLYRADGGLTTALDRFVGPDMCKVGIHNRQTGKRVYTTPLAPKDFLPGSDESLRAWSNAAWVFSGDTYRSPYDRDLHILPHQSPDVTPERLIYGAGLIAVFNRQLDLVESRVPAPV